VIHALRRRARFLKYERDQRRRQAQNRNLDEADLALSLDMDSDSRTLLLAFGGMNMGIGMPPFEFMSLTGEIPVKRLFVRDLHQAWYHRGVPGYGTTLTSVADSLAETLAEHDVERLIVTGNSAGGYAALVFGTLLRADVVLCFAPQTVLDLDFLASIGDHRWDDLLRPLVETNALDARWIDLGVAMTEAANGETVYRVFVDDTLSVDRLHVERLRGIDGLRVHRFGRGRHHLVRELRDSGALQHVLQMALHAPAGPDTPRL
jgi:pimeloyl-ACP methyl ester carboxylesterase